MKPLRYLSGAGFHTSKDILSWSARNSASTVRLRCVAVCSSHAAGDSGGSMSVRLFVGNLPYSVTETALREHFSAIGPLSYVYLPVDRETGKPRGFAFVEFSERAQAEEAIRRFNNQAFMGRPLAINEAREREDRHGSAPPVSRPNIGNRDLP